MASPQCPEENEGHNEAPWEKLLHWGGGEAAWEERRLVGQIQGPGSVPPWPRGPVRDPAGGEEAGGPVWGTGRGMPPNIWDGWQGADAPSHPTATQMLGSSTRRKGASGLAQPSAPAAGRVGGQPRPVQGGSPKIREGVLESSHSIKWQLAEGPPWAGEVLNSEGGSFRLSDPQCTPPHTHPQRPWVQTLPLPRKRPTDIMNPGMNATTLPGQHFAQASFLLPSGCLEPRGLPASPPLRWVCRRGGPSPSL